MALPRISMEQYLLQKGFLKPEQHEEAKKVAQQTGQPLDRVLISLNFVGEREVLQAKAQEMGYGFVDLDRIPTIESSAINVVPERIVKAHNAIPVKKDGNTLYVAMTNPSNIVALDDIKIASGLRVVPVLAVPAAIEDAIKKYYSGSSAAPAPSPGSPATPVAAAAAPTQVATSNYSDAMKRAIAEAGVNRDIATSESGADDDEKMAEQAPIIRLANALIQQANK